MKISAEEWERREEEVEEALQHLSYVFLEGVTEGLFYLHIDGERDTE